MLDHLPIPPRDVVTITTVSTLVIRQLGTRAIEPYERIIGELVIREDGYPKDATDLTYALRGSGYRVEASVQRTWTDATALEAMDRGGSAGAASARNYLESRLEGYSADESNTQLDPYVI